MPAVIVSTKLLHAFICFHCSSRQSWVDVALVLVTLTGSRLRTHSGHSRGGCPPAQALIHILVPGSWPLVPHTYSLYDIHRTAQGPPCPVERPARVLLTSVVSWAIGVPTSSIVLRKLLIYIARQPGFNPHTLVVDQE